MKISKFEKEIRLNHYEWCRKNGRDTSWFETDKRKSQAGRPKRKPQAQAQSR